MEGFLTPPLRQQGISSYLEMVLQPGRPIRLTVLFAKMDFSVQFYTSGCEYLFAPRLRAQAVTFGASLSPDIPFTDLNHFLCKAGLRIVSTAPSN